MPRKNLEARRAYNREYQRQWYRKSRELHLQRVQRVVRRVRAEARKYVDDCKKRPCADCGLMYPPYVMDFDHVRGEKLANISQLRSGRYIWDTIVAEIAKRDVVCANCHRERTHRRRLGVELTSDVRFPFGPEWISVVVPSS